MLHVIAQRFGRHLQPVFLSGVPSVRGFFIGSRRTQEVAAAGGMAALMPPPPAMWSAAFRALAEQPASGSEPGPAGRDANEREQRAEAEEQTYSDYEIAYQTGFEGFMRHGEKAGSFEAAEPELREEYEQRLPAPETERPMGTATALAAAQAHLLWDEARHAAKTAWKRAAKQLRPREFHQRAA
jgi:hypothetical protein